MWQGLSKVGAQAQHTLQQPLGYYTKAWLVRYIDGRICDSTSYLKAQQAPWYLA